MAPKVILYSPDKIRGQILLKTLAFSSMEGFLFTSHYEIREVLDDFSPSLLIFDAQENADNELRFLKSLLSPSLPPKKFIVLVKSDLKLDLTGLGLSGAVHIPDPLAPEYILSQIKDLLALQKKFSLKKFGRKIKAVFGFVPKFVLKTVLLLLVLSIGTAGGYSFWCLSSLPNIDYLGKYIPYETSKLYAEDNTLLAEFYIEKRTMLPQEKIPQQVKKAFIAVEDSNYYEHEGVDVFRVIGALIKDLKKGKFVQGGSTITQQLVKMLFLKPEKTITRKIQEIALAIKINKKYSKDEILGFYLNQAYFGTNAYGLEAASQAYFGKSTAALTLAEAALLAAIPKAPSQYSPFKNPEKAKRRRNFVLERMAIKGFITEEEHDQARSEPLPTMLQASKFKAPYFVDYCRGILEQRYGDRLRTAGWQIYTTLDYRIQQIAEQAVEKGLDELNKRGLTGVEAALLAVELKSGRIKAMVGGTNFWESQFNRATQAMRQPGSAFKPIVYLTALLNGYKPEDEIPDEEVTYSANGESWTPHNFDEVYHGIVTLDQAMTLSLNAATVNLAQVVKMENIADTARKLGIKSTIRPYYSSALGASEVTLLEMVSAYAALSDGKRIEPVCIDRIIDKKPFAVAEAPGNQETVISQEVLANIKLMLQNVVLNGTGKGAGVLARPVYGKTGTTNDFTDGWFIGFDDKLAVGVWVGRDNHAPLGENETGSRTALPIWVKFMKEL